MPFNYRDKSNLADRLRGKSGEEILNELKSDLDTQGRRTFFDSPSWRTRHSNSAFPRGFPFHDDQNRINIKTYLDEIASRHPEFANQLRESSWGEDFVEPPFPRAEGSESERKNVVSEASGSKEPEVPQPQQNLRNFGLRNTVPLGPQACSEQERQQRSMSAPPENSGGNRFITKCEIPVMNNPMQEPVQIKPDLAGKGPQESNLPKTNNAPNVRVIPIQVEGRDTPLVNTNVDTATNFGSESFVEPSFEGRLPRDFGTYQRHSPRFAHKERAPTPPQYQYAPQYQQYVPPSQHFMPSQHFVPHEQQAFGHQQQRPQKAGAPPPPHQQQQHQQHQKHQQQQPYQQQQQPFQQQQQPYQHQQPQHPSQSHQGQQGPKLPQGDEVDSKPPQQKSEPIKDPIEKVQAIQKEVEELMKEVEAFKGNSRTDKQYLMLDELLTRQLLLLDNIDTEGKDNVRQARKDTIRSIQRCISTLENKVPVVENEEKPSESASKEEEKPSESGASQPMEVDNTKENTPVGNKESQKMDVDETGGNVQQQEEQETGNQQEQRPNAGKEETKEKK